MLRKFFNTLFGLVNILCTWVWTDVRLWSDCCWRGPGPACTGGPPCPPTHGPGVRGSSISQASDTLSWKSWKVWAAAWPDRGACTARDPPETLPGLAPATSRQKVEFVEPAVEPVVIGAAGSKGITQISHTVSQTLLIWRSITQLLCLRRMIESLSILRTGLGQTVVSHCTLVH